MSSLWETQWIKKSFQTIMILMHGKNPAWLSSDSTAGQGQNFPALFKAGWGGKKKEEKSLKKRGEKKVYKQGK